MRRLSVSPCGAVPWVPSSIAQRGNGIGETPEEGGSCIKEVSLSPVPSDAVIRSIVRLKKKCRLW